MNLMSIVQLTIFSLGTIIIILVSKKSLRNFKVHGFYRFFVFEFTLALVLLNIPYWYVNPFSLHQIFSWVLLLISLYLIIQSISSLKKIGGSKKRENNSTKFAFESTVTLVKDGVYKYIRHPMYSSLLFLCLGALLKNISGITLLLIVIIILFLILTAKVEEKENINFFGKSYLEYMKKTKMFVPYIY
ncbi:MAG: methyltransferase [Ignavibacteriaceae bacterium]